MSWRLFLFLFVIVLFAFLIFLLLNPGSRWQPGSLDLSLPTLQQLRTRLTTKYDAADIRLMGGETGCRVDGTQLFIPNEGACSYLMASSSERTKVLRLQLQEGTASLGVVLSQENALTVEDTFTPEEDHLDLDVYRNEAEIDAELALQNCQVAPAAGEDDDEPRFCIVVVE